MRTSLGSPKRRKSHCVSRWAVLAVSSSLDMMRSSPGVAWCFHSCPQQHFFRRRPDKSAVVLWRRILRPFCARAGDPTTGCRVVRSNCGSSASGRVRRSATLSRRESPTTALQKRCTERAREASRDTTSAMRCRTMRQLRRRCRPGRT